MNYPFDFKKKDTYKMALSDTLFLHIERVTNSWASLYFTDEMNNRVPTPSEIRVYDNVYDENNGVLQLKQSNEGFYCLGWTENYLVKYKDEIILTIDNPRVVTISTFGKSLNEVRAKPSGRVDLAV
jgi:hypothetical protein